MKHMLMACADARGGAAAAGVRAARDTGRFKLRPDEALKILNIEPHQLNNKVLLEKYEKMFAINDPAKGGSFYLQSKVYRSKEVLQRELDVQAAEEEEEQAQAQAEAKSKQ